MSEYSPQQLKLLDELKKICPNPPKDMMVDCLLLKMLLDEQAAGKKKEIESKARDALQARHLEAMAFVIQKVQARQTQGIILLSALFKASTDYDQILSTRAAKPIAAEIILGLALAALPELKVIGRATKAYTGSHSWNAIVKDVQRSSAPNWETLTDEILKITQSRDKNNLQMAQKLTSFAQSLDATSKDIIEAIRNPLKAASDADDASKQSYMSYIAKNQILSGIISDIQCTLAMMTAVASILTRFLLWYKGDDILTLLQAAFQTAGLDKDIAYNGSAFTLYSDLILYDMLKSYVNRYFVVHLFGVRPGEFTLRPINLDDLPSDYEERYIDGLDKSQRRMIYAKFGTVRWSADQSRPPVKDYRDLLKHWKGTAKRDRHYTGTNRLSR